MAKYTVLLERELVEYCYVDIEASSKAEAMTEAYSMDYSELEFVLNEDYCSDVIVQDIELSLVD